MYRYYVIKFNAILEILNVNEQGYNTTYMCGPQLKFMAITNYSFLQVFHLLSIPFVKKHTVAIQFKYHGRNIFIFLNKTSIS